MDNLPWFFFTLPLEKFLAIVDGFLHSDNSWGKTSAAHPGQFSELPYQSPQLGNTGNYMPSRLVQYKKYMPSRAGPIQKYLYLVSSSGHKLFCIAQLRLSKPIQHKIPMHITFNTSDPLNCMKHI